jgi:hypothetical protein
MLQYVGEDQDLKEYGSAYTAQTQRMEQQL